MREIEDSDIVRFNKVTTAALLKRRFPDIDVIQTELLHYERGSFAITFGLATEQQIMLNISILDEPGNAVEEVFHELCELFECRAFDTTAGEFL